MTDTTQAVNPEPQAGEGKQSGLEQPNTGQEPTPAATWTLDEAVAEIGRLRKEAAGHRRDKAAAEKAKADAEALSLAEQGKYKELYEKTLAKANQADALKAAHDALIEQVKAANEKRIAAIPEAMRGLVPDYDDPQKVAAWLEANSAVFAKSPAPNLDGRAGGNGNGAAAVSDEEVRDFAVRMGVPFDYVDRAALAKMRQR